MTRLPKGFLLLIPASDHPSETLYVSITPAGGNSNKGVQECEVVPDGVQHAPPQQAGPPSYGQPAPQYAAPQQLQQQQPPPQQYGAPAPAPVYAQPGEQLCPLSSNLVAACLVQEPFRMLRQPRSPQRECHAPPSAVESDNTP